MTEITPENVSGFVTGEGCFYAQTARDKEYKHGCEIRVAFCIELREDDREILEAIQVHLGCGRIYDLDFGRYRDYATKNWRAHVKLRVGGIRDICEKVIPFFKKYPPFGHKKQCFDIWCQIAEKIYQKQHLIPEGIEELKKLKQQLQLLNKKGKITDTSMVRDSLDALDALVQWG